MTALRNAQGEELAPGPLELASFTSKRQDTQALHLGFSVRAGRLSVWRAWGVRGVVCSQ